MATLDHRALRGPTSLLSEFPGLWGIAGGWAVDLFVGHQSRTHADVDVALLRDNQRELHQMLDGARIEKVIGGKLSPWLPDETLELPTHEVHATWPDGYRLEFLLNECDDQEWFFRRDPRVRRPLRSAFVGDTIVPYLAPEIVLLFKSKAPAPKDYEDLELVSARLAHEPRTWLLEALAATAPGDPWAEILAREA